MLPMEFFSPPKGTSYHCLSSNPKPKPCLSLVRKLSQCQTACSIYTCSGNDSIQFHGFDVTCRPNIPKYRSLDWPEFQILTFHWLLDISL